MPPVVTTHQQALALATAALMDIISRAQAMQAAVIRGAEPAELETMRQEMHDVLDGYVDRNIEAASAVKALAQP